MDFRVSWGTRLFSHFLLIRLIVPGTALCHEIEISVRNHVYLNDEYGFALPLPSAYTGCIGGLGGEGGAVMGAGHFLTIVPREYGCSSQNPSRSINIYAQWAFHPDRTTETAADEICASREASASQAHFGNDPMFRCNQAGRSGEVEFFLIKARPEGSQPRATEFHVTVNGFGTDPSAVETRVDKILSEARFLTD
jgi:hypothetical protein